MLHVMEEIIIIEYTMVLNSRDSYEKLWLPEFSHLKTTLQQALAKKLTWMH